MLERSLFLAGLLLVVTACGAPSGTPQPAGTPPEFPVVPAPDFALEGPSGEVRRLSDYAGDVVLLNFWSLSCAACLDEMELLDAYYREHRALGFTVVAVNVDDPARIVAAFVAERDLTFPVLLDARRQVAAAYGVAGVPTTFFVDREGTVAGYWPGELTEEMLDAALAPLLQEETP